MRGLEQTLSHLLVIDGSEALGTVIDEMFGERAHVQRFRTHKLRNALERLPETETAEDQGGDAGTYKLAPQEGMAELKPQAQWLEREHVDAAVSLLERPARDLLISNQPQPHE